MAQYQTHGGGASDTLPILRAVATMDRAPAHATFLAGHDLKPPLALSHPVTPSNTPIRHS